MNESLKLTQIVARDLPEAWFLCIKGCMEHGVEYTVAAGGSHAGIKRKEFDSITLLIREPWRNPIIPLVPEGVPPPTSMDYVETYLPYLMTSKKQPREEYTYGSYIEPQLPKFIELLKQGEGGTNQACMNIGGPEAISLPSPPCLRMIDARIRYGHLHFYVYFRSWDLWGGLPTNLAAIEILQEYVASELDIPMGQMIAYSKGLHLYDHHWDLAKRILGKGLDWVPDKDDHIPRSLVPPASHQCEAIATSTRKRCNQWAYEKYQGHWCCGMHNPFGNERKERELRWSQ